MPASGAGIPYDWIVDETREAESVPSWATPDAYVEVIRRAYRKDHWALQPRRVEVWSEKGTVRGTLAPILNQYGITFRVMHGFTSTTNVAVVMEERRRNRERPFLAIYVGDFDPSGLYMSEVDLPQRITAHHRRLVGLDLVAFREGLDPRQEYYGRWHDKTPAELEALGEMLLMAGEAGEASALGDLTVRRVALTETDVLRGDLLHYDVTTKSDDTRYDWYCFTYGNQVNEQAWELDAMNPNDLRARVEAAIREQIDVPTWERSVAAEGAEAASLRAVLDRWNSNGQP